MKRYNEYGLWKPYLSKDNYDEISKDIKSLELSDDVKDVLFYVRYTNSDVIEFVVKTYLELPKQLLSFSKYNIEFYRCDHIYEYCKTKQLNIYDCSFPLEDTNIDTISRGLRIISIEMNKVAFFFDVPLSWRLKYKSRETKLISKTPTLEKLLSLDVPGEFSNSVSDRIFLNAAAEWYRIGNYSDDIVVAFSAYYFALETLVFAKTNENVDLNMENTYVKSDVSKCFDEIISSQLPKEEIIRKLNADCLGSNRDKTIWFIKQIFGDKNQNVNEFTNDKKSLYSIRCKIVHGHKDSLSNESISLIMNKLPVLKRILREIMIRICFYLQPSDPLPDLKMPITWRGLTGDPRQDEIVPSTEGFDYRIRPEWCE